MTRITAAVLCVLTLNLHADTWSLLHDNDMVFDSDDSYTAGIQIGWMGERYDRSEPGSFTRGYIDAAKGALSLLGVPFAGRRLNGAISLQSAMLTPENLESSEPVYDDIPYVGALSANFTLFSWSNRNFDAYYASVGLIGRHSGAEQIQKTVHEIVGATDPQGWDNQLGTAMILQAGYVRGIRQSVMQYGDDRRLEWFNSYHVDVGTFYCGAGMGTSLRFGSNMPWNFATSSGVLNSVSGEKLGFDTLKKDFGWEIRTGLFVSGVAYFHLYEESKRLGYDYDMPRFIPRANIGAGIYWEQVSIAFDLFPSGTAGTNPRSASFGRMTVTWSLE